MEFRNFTPKKQALFQNGLDLAENMKNWMISINQLIINTMANYRIVN